MKRTPKRLNTARAAGAATVPGVKEHKTMKRKFGFTLVELLVVIAIISILAAIVTPRVQTYILRGRMTHAVSEVHNIELALTTVLTQAGKDNYRQLFQDGDGDPNNDNAFFDQPTTPAELLTQVGLHTDAFYAILRQGRSATLPAEVKFADGVAGKLSTSYLDLGLDSWDQKYRFWIGPWRGYDGGSASVPFRGWRAGTEYDDGTPYDSWKYDSTNFGVYEGKLPGNPPADDLEGYPAPKDLGIYIFSTGVNMRIDQLFGDVVESDHAGGGDDINNWDREGGWEGFYS